MQKQPINPDPPRRYLRRPEVERLTGIRRSQLYRLIQAGKFPRPVKLSERCAAWPSDEVQAFLDARHRERDTAGEG